MDDGSKRDDTNARETGLNPRAEQKCAQLIDGARAVILAKGLDGASVDDIAREAGMSKATMYRYFPHKAALFAAIMQRDCARQSAAMCGAEPDGRPLADVLRDLAVRHITFVTSDFAEGLFRAAVAESGRYPEVGQAFYASNMDRGRAWLSPVLAAAAERGELAVDLEPDLAAHRFFALCRADIFFKRLFGLTELPGEAEIDAHARSAVDAFLRIYRPE